ncbi:MAG: hypothetical protein JNK05_28105 [Myxococcales bacterium]|nr:hypothetical protein [Myxococcales bacterium]
MRGSVRAAALIAAVSSASGVARGDVPPEPGYVETCTVERQQTQGVRCENCQRLRGDVDATCAQQMASRGWVERCQGGGATVGFVLYCSAPAPAGFDVRAGRARGCASCSVGKPQSALVTAMVLAAASGVAWIVHRRSASKRDRARG